MSHKHVVYQIVDRDCHAMSTKLEVVRHVVSRTKGGRRTFLVLPRETRHEIVGAALFLMSDASSFTTGSILRADGGFA